MRDTSSRQWPDCGCIDCNSVRSTRNFTSKSRRYFGNDSAPSRPCGKSAGTDCDDELTDRAARGPSGIPLDGFALAVDAFTGGVAIVAGGTFEDETVIDDVVVVGVVVVAAVVVGAAFELVAIG